MGMTMVVRPDDLAYLEGIFTDGDLRRLLEHRSDLQALQIDEVMIRAPLSIAPDRLAIEALRCMDEHQITQLAVLENERIVGALHLHDLLAAKIA
jgi:arabinose-5-phosphate isomerase